MRKSPRKLTVLPHNSVPSPPYEAQVRRSQQGLARVGEDYAVALDDIVQLGLGTLSLPALRLLPKPFEESRNLQHMPQFELR